MAGTRRPSDVAEGDETRRQGGVDRQAVPVVRRRAIELLLPPRAIVVSTGDRRGGVRADPRGDRGQPDARRAIDHRRGAAEGEERGEPEEGAPHHQAQRLAGAAQVAGEAPTGAGLDVACEQGERALGGRRDARLLRSRRLVSPDGDHRLLGPDDRWVAAVEDRVAKIAAAALEDALRAREIDPAKNELTLRSDNGLVFGAKPFVKVVRRYGLDQEYITPYTPEQNGMIERFFGTLKSECVWQHRFQDRDQAFDEIARWIDRYHTERPHSALGYLTPAEFREKLAA